MRFGGQADLLVQVFQFSNWSFRFVDPKVNHTYIIGVKTLDISEQSNTSKTTWIPLFTRDTKNPLNALKRIQKIR